MSHAALYIASREGVPGFFRGISPSLLMVAPQTGFQFAIYHTFNQIVSTIRHHCEGRIKKVSASNLPSSQLKLDQGAVLISYPVGPVQSVIAGGLAGMGSKCIIYPLDMAKKRMQINGFEEARVKFGRVPIAQSLRICLVNTWRNEGPTALFKGLPPTLLKSCVSVSCRFTVYEQVCRLLKFYHHSAGSSSPF